MIDETPLRAIVSLSKTSSFQESAKELAVSNATLTRIIQRAEEQLGMVLFERGRTGSALTSEGRAFLPLAERLLGDLARFHKTSAAIRFGGETTLSVGCGPLTTRTLVAPVLQAMLAETPTLRCRIDVSAANEPIAMLERGEIDVFVGDLTHTPRSEQIEIQILERRQVIFVIRRGHPLQSGGPHHLRDVLDRFPMGSPFLHKHWQAALAMALGGDEAAADLAAQLPAMQCDDYALLADLCCNSDLVVGGMPETFAEFLVSGALRRLPLTEELRWNICIARRLGRPAPMQERFWNGILAQKQAAPPASRG
ncbi:LysR family transcriptional regulator [Shimia sp. SDUM112013]|uniref:LysR family transcriptional regulator n=1 Tax=Shimia sp. SDUM112013 TaxID=3136160 RepID=UPI0032EFF43A